MNIRIKMKSLDALNLGYVSAVAAESKEKIASVLP
jgi:hypothetical protein